MTQTAKPLSVLIVSGALLLGGCAGTIGLPASAKKSDGSDAAAPQSSFAQFSDIPIPSGAKMDLEKSLVLGSNEAWIGRLVMNSAHNTAAMFDFFKQRSGEFGWQEVTSVRSKTSVLTFTRGERVMTIQIEGLTISGSEMNITVAPRETGSVASAPTANPMTAPAPRAPVDRLR